MNIYRTTRELMLGSRLRRLSERLLSDVARIYRSVEIDFEAPWFPLFYLLKHRGTITVSELAREVEITQSGASQMVTMLEKKGLVRTDSDPADKRIRTVSFTPEGEALCAEVQPVWKALSASTQGLLGERQHSAHLLSAFDELEAGLDDKGLHGRTMNDLEKRLLLDKLEMFDYAPDYETVFRDLVLGWLQENPVHGIEDTGFLNETGAMVEDGRLVVLLAGLEVTRPEADNSEADSSGADGPEKNIVAAVVAQYEKGNQGDERADARIVLIAVNPAYNKMELEAQLLSQVLAELAKKGVTRVGHVLDSKNSERIRIFQQQGFQLEGMHKPGEDALTLNLSKSIDPK